LTAPELGSLLWVTLKVASTSTAVSLVPGVATGWFLAHRKSPWVEAAVNLPLVVPPVAAGLALLTVLHWLDPDVVFTWVAAAIAAMVMAFPLLVRSVQQAFAAVPGSLEQSAATLGASPWDVFRTISLPLARRGIVNGSLLTFARSLGEFGATMLVAGIVPGSTETLATGIYSRIVNNHTSDAWILAGLAGALSFGAIFVANRLQD
jgi:molybdate transport system permease protein